MVVTVFHIYIYNTRDLNFFKKKKLQKTKIHLKFFGETQT